MVNKKFMILAIFLVSLLAISGVSASDNATKDIIGVDDAIGVNNLNEEHINVNDLENYKINNSDTNISRNCELQEEISSYNDNDVLSEKSSLKSPPSNYYSVFVNSAQVDSGSTGTIKINIDSCYYTGYYKYDFNLQIVSSNGQLQAGKRFTGTSAKSTITYSFKANFHAGSYAIKAVNVKDGNVMSTATLTVKGSTPVPSAFPSANEYSVIVSDTDSGSIDMSIYPSFSSTYAYYYYLKVYDSNNNLKISKTYSNLNKQYSETYIINSNLSPGIYTIKIINHADGKLMCIAKLTVKDDSPSSFNPSVSDYSVSVSDTIINYEAGGTISMSISPAYDYNYKYYYYLKVYDSNYNEKISQVYGDTILAYSRTYTVGAYQLSPGTYTIEIINYRDGKVMDTAMLTVEFKPNYPSYSDYSVRFSDKIEKQKSAISISMIISPASSSNYKYYYYLKIYDMYNNEKVSQLFYGNSPEYSKSYTINANQLNSGNTYDIKIINFLDNMVMDSVMLIVNFSSIYYYPSGSDYSVSVSDTSINYESGGTVSMSISPAYDYNYKYYYYLKVYDSNYKEKISQTYCDTILAYSRTYTVGAYQLLPGTYTIKIINYDGEVMDTASLIVNKMPTKKEQSKIFLRNALYFVTQTKMVQVTLWDGNNKPIANKMVYIKAYNSVWKGITDKNGDAYIRVGIGFGVHDATVSFDGDNHYATSSKVGKIRVIKETPSVMVRGVDTQFKTSANSKVVKVYLWDRTSKPLPVGSKIFIRINGQQFVGTTDSQGIAHVKININYAGTFNAQVIYTGNTAYNAVTRDIKIRIV